MKKRDRKYDLDEFRRYQEERMTDEEQHRFEKEMLENPLLPAAYEGFLLLRKDGKDHPAMLRSLNRQLQRRVARKYPIAILKYAGAAIVFFTAGYFLFLRSPGVPESGSAALRSSEDTSGIAVIHNEVVQIGVTGFPSTEKEPVREVSGRRDDSMRRSLKGKVTDQNGKPLSGVVLFQSGEKIGTTDINGVYNIVSPSPDSVEFILLAYLTKKISPGSIGNVMLAKDKSVLGDLAVGGYGKNNLDEQLIVAGYVKPALIDLDTNKIKAGPKPVNGWKNFEEYLKNATKETLMYGHTLHFVVLRNGKLGDITVDGPDSLKSEMIRILKEGPEWIPGQDDSSRVTLPMRAPKH